MTTGWHEYEDVETGILFMKVGEHAQESLEDIIVRKQREIDDAGFALWGYGGNTCHPILAVQPFANGLAAAGHRLVLAMQPMKSHHRAEPLRKEQYSVDGENWEAIPRGVNALGSKYALWLDSLEAVDVSLPLASTRVAVGPSAGRLGEGYISGHVDKACLRFVPAAGPGSPEASIRLVANLASPYAVLLR